MKCDNISTFRILGPQRDAAISLSILFLSLILFAFKKPSNPIINENSYSKIMVNLALSAGFCMILSMLSRAVVVLIAKKGLA